MKAKQRVISMVLSLILIVTITSVDSLKIIAYNTFGTTKEQVVEADLKAVSDKSASANIAELPEAKEGQKKVEIVPIEEPELTVYDNLTKQQLIEKLNRSLNSTISGKGEIFADVALELGMDPYLGLAIVMEETGCAWDCSYLTKMCNNVGGMKGYSECGGTYQSFPTIDEGIRSFLYNLYYNYIAHGLTTAESINTKYAESQTWHIRINEYISKIRAN